MEEVRKLLDNGWQVLLFRDGLGSYSALAVGAGSSVDDAKRRWSHYLPRMRNMAEIKDSVFAGPNRYVGCGHTVDDALRAVTEKVLFRRLPERKEITDG